MRHLFTILSLLIGLGFATNITSAHAHGTDGDGHVTGRDEVTENCWFKGQQKGLIFPIGGRASDQAEGGWVFQGDHIQMTGAGLGKAVVYKDISPARPDLFAVLPCIPGLECPKDSSGEYLHLSDIHHIFRANPDDPNVDCSPDSPDFNNPTRCYVFDHEHLLSAMPGDYDIPNGEVVLGNDNPAIVRYDGTFDIWGVFYNPENPPAPGEAPHSLNDLAELVNSGKVIGPMPFKFTPRGYAEPINMVLKLPVVAPLGEDSDLIPPQ